MVDAQLSLEARDPNAWFINGQLTTMALSNRWRRFDKCRPKKGAWVIDCGGVSKMDSAGIAYILTCVKYAKKNRLGIKLHHMPEEVFQLMKAQGVMPLIEPLLS